ncbi:MAG TPA: 30S ribosomal protein S6 [Solirubrobacterales bacterium]|nr:30S ribosomal protein S6 [Solirubrobacterales bacterium]
MAAPREYELVLMLDPGPDEAGRDALAQDVRARIEGKGTLKHENKWGLRKMAYEIGGRNEADYRWLRFEAPTELLDELNHNLKIADGVLRFRIFKVDADAPVMVPPTVAAPAPGASRDRGERGPQGPPRPAVATEPSDESAESVAEPAESAPESADVPVAADE